MNIDMLLANAKARFDTILYQLTQPGLPASQRIGKLGSTKVEVTRVLMEIANIKKQITEQVDVEKVDMFIRDCNKIYTDAINFVTNDMVGDPNMNPEYTGEAAKQAGQSTIIPPNIMNGQAKESFMNQMNNFQAVQAPSASSPLQALSQSVVAPVAPVITSEQLLSMSTLNFSNSIKIEDGEAIPDPAPAELYYVIDPYTVNCQVRIVRFMSPDKVSEFVFNNFKNDDVKPFIMFGKVATIQHSISIAI